MLAQDPVTGYLHEMPDGQVYGVDEMGYPMAGLGEAPVLYDGLGNPVGLPFLAPIAAALAPALAPMAGKLIGGLLPQAARAAGGIIPQVARAAGGLIPQVAQAAGGLMRQLLPFPRPGMPMPRPMPMPMPRFPFPFPPHLRRPRPFCRAPAPVGWVTPALPYTGMQPRRMYLRCSVWPGPAGLVPQAPGTFPMLPGPAAAPISRLRRRRMRRR